MLGIISNIQRFTLHDGPGIRTTVFMQGCPLDCWWCHNPESKAYCLPEGNDEHQQYTPEQLFLEIKKDWIFMEESKGGVTFSGGEPFSQHQFLAQMLDLCKAEEIHTAVDTSGMVNSKIFESMIHKPDLFLFDIKFVDGEQHKKYTGVHNTIILKNLGLLVKHHKKINIRIPLIPGINDSEKCLNEFKQLMNKLRLENLNLLPFHRIAEGKYKRLGMENRLINLRAHTDEEIATFKHSFEKDGFEVKIGG